MVEFLLPCQIELCSNLASDRTGKSCQGGVVRPNPRNFPLPGVAPTVMSPAAISVSEKVRYWISVYQNNPTRFDVHILALCSGV